MAIRRKSAGEELTRLLPGPGEHMNLRGEIVATKKQTSEVWMLTRVRGEDGEPLVARTRQTVSAGFARSLIHEGRAEPYAEQDKRARGGKGSSKKAASEGDES